MQQNEKFDSGMYVEYRVTRKDPERSLSLKYGKFCFESSPSILPRHHKAICGEQSPSHMIYILFSAAI